MGEVSPQERDALRPPLSLWSHEVTGGTVVSATQPKSTQTQSTQTQSIGFWSRFHVRLTILYGVAVFGVLLPMTYAFYTDGVEREVSALRLRMATTVTALSSAIEQQAVLELNSPADAARPQFKRLNRRFAEVCSHDPEIKNIYILLKTDKPKTLRFAIDHISDGSDDNAEIGELYDAAPWPDMLAGLEEVRVESELGEDAWGVSISAYAPLKDAIGNSFGLVGVDVKGTKVEAHKASVLNNLGVIALFALMVLSIASFLVSRNVQGPLSEMMNASGAIADGHFDTRLALNRSDEFGLVGSRFDEMAAGLQEREHIRATFGRFVSREVASTLLNTGASLGGEVRDVTVLFTDLVGYSTITEKLSPQEVVGLLNRYLGGMNGVIDAHQGVVIEFLGDAILAVFGAPNSLDDHASQALKCALAMQRRLDELNAVWAEEGVAELWKQVGIERLAHRVGIHSGEVVAGNLGSATRAKYAVIGDTVNVAARLEQLNKELGTKLLCSDEVTGAVEGELRESLKRVGEFQVKGRASSVGAWTIAEPEV